MEESVRNKVLATMKTKGRQKWARRRAHLVYCASPMCKITAHTCEPDETKLGMMPRFLGMSCFEIAHTPEANNLFTCIGRKGKEYLRSIPSHPICEEIVQAYTKKSSVTQSSDQEESLLLCRQAKIRYQPCHHLIWILTYTVLIL